MPQLMLKKTLIFKIFSWPLILITLFSSPTPIVLAQIGSTMPSLTEKLLCVGKAVQEREDALTEVFNEKTEILKIARENRKRQLFEAWKITDSRGRNRAILGAWQEFRDVIDDSRKVYRGSVNAIWKKFAKEKLKCKLSPIPSESASTDSAL